MGSQHFGTGDRVRAVFDESTSRARALYELSRTSLSRDHSYYWDDVDGLSVAYTLTGGRNDNNK